jgi:hypothetical protein
MEFTSKRAKPGIKPSSALLGLMTYIILTTLSAWLALYVKDDSWSSVSTRFDPESSTELLTAANLPPRETFRERSLPFEEQRGRQAKEAIIEFEGLEKAETGKSEVSEESVGCGERIELRPSAFRFASSSSPFTITGRPTAWRRETNRSSSCPCSTPPYSCSQPQTPDLAGKDFVSNGRAGLAHRPDAARPPDSPTPVKMKFVGAGQRFSQIKVAKNQKRDAKILPSPSPKQIAETACKSTAPGELIAIFARNSDAALSLPFCCS